MTPAGELCSLGTLVVALLKIGTPNLPEDGRAKGRFPASVVGLLVVEAWLKRTNSEEAAVLATSRPLDRANSWMEVAALEGTTMPVVLCGQLGQFTMTVVIADSDEGMLLKDTTG